jgi:flavin-dependent dehydrogenase
MCPELADRLKDATLVDDAVHATGNFSYSSTHATGDRYLMLGDAFTFIDPMFSSGVYLAMHSAFDGAEAGGHGARPAGRNAGGAPGLRAP